MSDDNRWTPCREIVELVTDYLEGALDMAARLNFEEHLAACPPCRDYLQQMRRTMELAARLGSSLLSPAARGDLILAFRGRGSR